MIHGRLYRAAYAPSGSNYVNIPDVISADWSFARKLSLNENTGQPEPRAIRATGRLHLYDLDIAETLLDLTTDGASNLPSLKLYYEQLDGTRRVKTFSNVIFGAPASASLATSQHLADEDNPASCVVPFTVAMQDGDSLSNFVNTANA